MEGPYAWAAMSVITMLSVFGAMLGVERATGISGSPSRRLELILAGGSAAGLVAIGLLYQWRDFVEIDAGFVESLSLTRGESLVSAMRVLTTMGDTMPSYLIAALLAIWLMRRHGAGLWALILPGVVLLELAAQFAYSKIFPVLVLGDITPDLPIDGSGDIPSGSTARLMSIFLIACLIYRRSRPGRGLWLADLGAILVVVEIFSRMYLGRHFVGDIIGGIFLGILLALFGAFLLTFAKQRTSVPSPATD